MEEPNQHNDDAAGGRGACCRRYGSLLLNILACCLLAISMGTCSFLGVRYRSHGPEEIFGVGLFRRENMQVKTCSGDVFVETGSCEAWTDDEKEQLFDPSWDAARVLIAFTVVLGFLTTCVTVIERTIPSIPRKLFSAHYSTVALLTLLTLVGLKQTSLCEDYCNQASMASCVEWYELGGRQFRQAYYFETECRQSVCFDPVEKATQCRQKCEVNLDGGGYCSVLCEEAGDMASESFQACQSTCLEDFCMDEFQTSCSVAIGDANLSFELIISLYPGNYIQYCRTRLCGSEEEEEILCLDTCREIGFCGMHCKEKARTLDEDHGSFLTCKDGCISDICGGLVYRECEKVGSCEFGYGAGLVVVAGFLYLLLAFITFHQVNEPPRPGRHRISSSPCNEEDHKPKPPRQLPSDIET